MSRPRRACLRSREDVAAYGGRLDTRALEGSAPAADQAPREDASRLALRETMVRRNGAGHLAG